MSFASIAAATTPGMRTFEMMSSELKIGFSVFVRKKL